MRVRVEGLKALNSSLMELKSSTARGVVRRTLLKAMEPMAEEARRLAPDDPTTGEPDLHRSIAVSTRQKTGRQIKFAKATPTEVNVYMGPTKEGYPQAIMQEFGTVHHPPQPYMRPAWDGGKDQLLEDVSTGLGEEIAKTAARLAKRARK